MAVPHGMSKAACHDHLVALNTGSLDWAYGFIRSRSDSDLFPPSPEWAAIEPLKGALLAELARPELPALQLGVPRRFLVPKDEISYRQATQLDPQDALVLTAIVHEHGAGIEARRLPGDRVFSYRFAPSDDGMYEETRGWNQFWTAVRTRAASAGRVVYCDIADFYNQVYHHTLENELTESGFTNQATKWILGLCQSTTQGVSRGIPIGPHACHLLAEATLIPIDDSLTSHGLDFVRYADDIVLFVKDETAARAAFAVVAQTLDRQQRLTLQRHKSQIFLRAEAQQLAASMIEDQPISEKEADLLALVRKYANNNPYRTVWFSEISDSDWLSITQETLEGIIEHYFCESSVNYPRLSWLYRRLAQLGHPGALQVTLRRLDGLIPCLASVIAYIASLQKIEPDEWARIGEQLLGLLDNDLVQNQEYYEVQLLSLFARNRNMNHFARIAQRYATATPAGRRQILLAASENGAIAWLRELKEDFLSMDPGQKTAFLFGLRDFPRDERRYFIGRNQAGLTRPFEAILAKAARG